MSLLMGLVSFGLRQVVGEPDKMVASFLEQRLIDHNQALPRALVTANNRA